jgi:hypothetical protein
MQGKISQDSRPNRGRKSHTEKKMKALGILDVLGKSSIVAVGERMLSQYPKKMIPYR